MPTTEIYQIISDYPGQLFIMPKPSPEGTRTDITYYKSRGADTIVSMLDVAEADALSLTNEAAICAENQLEFINYPIPDFGLPDEASFKKLIGNIVQRLHNNEGVAVHCRAGIGRSGMLVCCVLTTFVGSATLAIEIVSKARGVQVPDTPEQRDFIIKMGRDTAD